MIDRIEWLKEKRREAEEQYNTIWAPLYGEKYGLYPNATHERFIQKVLSLVPHTCTILDAACGAGRYFPMLLRTGCTVLGIDQSEGMLARAKEKYANVRLEKVGLQEMAYEEDFDSAICMDAMENICPEDWLAVLSNLRHAIKAKGFLYFTVEMADEDEIRKAFIRAKKAGLPVIFGEVPDGACYHYYPSLLQAKGWIKQAQCESMEEGQGDGYYHFLVRRTK